MRSILVSSRLKVELKLEVLGGAGCRLVPGVCDDNHLWQNLWMSFKLSVNPSALTCAV